MARAKRKPPRRWVLGLLLLTVSLLTALSLTGPGWGSMTGPFGWVWVAFWVQWLGVPGLALFVVVGVLWGLALLARLPRGIFWGQLIFVGPFVILWDAFSQGFHPPREGGDLHGEIATVVHFAVRDFFGPGAAMQHGLALGALAMAATVFLFRYGLPASVGEGLTRASGVVARFVSGGLNLVGHGLGAIGRGFWRGAMRPAGLVVAAGATRVATGVAEGARELWLRPREEAREAELDSAARRMMNEERAGGPLIGPDAEPELAVSATDLREQQASAPEEALPVRETRGASAAEPPYRPKRKGPAPEVPRGARPVAPLNLLRDRDEGGSEVSRDEVAANAQLLKDTLASFGIAGEVSEVHPGPVITRYEFTPGVGVTISQITSRQTDLALAMRAPRVRMLAPIPGKAAVGVEIPNREPALIGFKSVAGRKAFFELRGELGLALGKDVAGRPFYTALEKMPHLLVAGTTGSGKSVCMNTLIVSMLMRNTPDRLRLLLIDPKMLEFTGYNGIPHLLQPVVTDAKEAAKALRWLTREMERRYRILAGVGVRNIAGYHQKQAEGGEHVPEAPMPYIVVLVDELADLMLSNASEVEVPIARLAQMARAVGIHLVLATQRPSVDVITGVIKANFPARIAFQVATRTDSRTILDMNGAESLLGRGDMLFIPPGKAEAHRIHGAFISDEETEQIVAYLQQFPTPESLIETEQEGGLMGDEEEQDDPLYSEAIKIVVSSGQGSTSMLQRKLRVGYTRAGRLMDMLERSGVVGPPDGSRAREVLYRPDQLPELLGSEAAVSS